MYDLYIKYVARYIVINSAIVINTLYKYVHSNIELRLRELVLR